MREEELLVWEARWQQIQKANKTKLQLAMRRQESLRVRGAGAEADGFALGGRFGAWGLGAGPPTLGRLAEEESPQGSAPPSPGAKASRGRGEAALAALAAVVLAESFLLRDSLARLKAAAAAAAMERAFLTPPAGPSAAPQHAPVTRPRRTTPERRVVLRFLAAPSVLGRPTPGAEGRARTPPMRAAPPLLPPAMAPPGDGRSVPLADGSLSARVCATPRAALQGSDTAMELTTPAHVSQPLSPRARAATQLVAPPPLPRRRAATPEQPRSSHLGIQVSATAAAACVGLGAHSAPRSSLPVTRIEWAARSRSMSSERVPPAHGSTTPIAPVIMTRLLWGCPATGALSPRRCALESRCAASSPPRPVQVALGGLSSAGGIPPGATAAWSLRPRHVVQQIHQCAGPADFRPDGSTAATRQARTPPPRRFAGVARSPLMQTPLPAGCMLPMAGHAGPAASSFSRAVPGPAQAQRLGAGLLQTRLPEGTATAPRQEGGSIQVSTYALPPHLVAALPGGVFADVAECFWV